MVEKTAKIRIEAKGIKECLKQLDLATKKIKEATFLYEKGMKSFAKVKRGIKCIPTDETA